MEWSDDLDLFCDLCGFQPFTRVFVLVPRQAVCSRVGPSGSEVVVPQRKSSFDTVASLLLEC